MSRILAVFALVAAMTSFSFADILLGDWENSMDGWVLSPGTTGSPVLGVGNTLNDYSLAIKAHTGPWDVAFSSDWSNVRGYADVKEYWAYQTGFFFIDVTLKASEWVTSGQINPIDQLILQDNVNSWGWQQFDNTWTWNPSMGDVTKTFFFDLPMQGAVDSFRFMIATAIGNPTVEGNIYYDNARLGGIPEPATMSLLGLGGLALIRRKR